MNANVMQGKTRIPISRRVIACVHTVSNQLGPGFLEQVYANALSIELERAGIMFEKEKPIAVFYEDREVGRFVADFVVEEELILELKALRALTGDHEAQALNYLAATGLSAALLVNFGRARVQVRRLVRKHDDSQSI